MPERKGITVEVFKRSNPSWPDCSNGGVTSKHHTLVVVGTKNGDGPIVPVDGGISILMSEEDWPSVVLVNRPRVCLVPLEYLEDGLPKGHVGPMAGGNAAGTTDSRWSELGQVVGNQRISIVPVHDRIESQELYDALSI